MQVSTASVDITPPLGYPMAGYGTIAGPRRSEGVNEPLRARCTILWDADGPKILVTADVLGFCRTLHRRIRQKVVALGVDSADFVLTATHTHNGPVLIDELHPYISYAIDDLAEVVDYSDALVTQIAALVQSALNAVRSTCTLDYVVLDENFSYNREALPYAERDVPTLVARALDGTPRAVLFGYGAHPVAAASSTLCDPDYPGKAIAVIEDAFEGCTAQFLLGPAGDQNPLSTTSGFEQSDAYGLDLGLTIVDQIGSAGRELTGPIETAYAEAQLPFDVLDTPQNRSLLASAFTARSQNVLSLPAWYERHGEVMVQVVDDDQTPLESFLPVPVQRWRFAGDPGLDMVLCGGEVMSGYAVFFRGMHGGSEQLWFAAYANEVSAYIPSDEVLSRSSYGAGWDEDAPGIAGGSMTVYGHAAHLLSGAPDDVQGAEQVFIDQIEALLQ